jgi:outer membrane biogenesis lipoprotein LolB
MRFVLYAFTIVAVFVLIGCNQNKETNLPTDNQPSTKLEQLRLHFAGFTKSKSGAT